MVKFNVRVLALALLGLLGAATPIAAEESVTVKEMDTVMNPDYEAEELQAGGGWRRTLRGSDEDLATPVSDAKAEEPSKKRKLWVFATNVAQNPSTLWRAPEGAAGSEPERQLFFVSCGFLWSCVDHNWMLKPSCGMSATEWLVQILGCW